MSPLFCANPGGAPQPRPATRYLFHHVLLTDAPISLWLPGLEERRRRFLQGLAENKPAFILVGLRDPNIMEPRDSHRQLRRFPALYAFVLKHYVADHSRPGLQVYRRR